MRSVDLVSVGQRGETIIKVAFASYLESWVTSAVRAVEDRGFDCGAFFFRDPLVSRTRSLSDGDSFEGARDLPIWTFGRSLELESHKSRISEICFS